MGNVNLAGKGNPEGNSTDNLNNQGNPDDQGSQSISLEDFNALKSQFDSQQKTLEQLSKSNEELTGKIGFYQEESKKNHEKYAGIRDTLANAFGVDREKEDEFNPKQAIEDMGKQFSDLQKQLKEKEIQTIQHRLDDQVRNIAKEKGIPDSSIPLLQVLFPVYTGTPDPEKGINVDPEEVVDQLIKHFPNLKFDAVAHAKELEEKKIAQEKAQKSSAQQFASVSSGMGQFTGAPNIGSGKTDHPDTRNPVTNMNDAHAIARAKLERLLGHQ